MISSSSNKALNNYKYSNSENENLFNNKSHMKKKLQTLSNQPSIKRRESYSTRPKLNSTNKINKKNFLELNDDRNNANVGKCPEVSIDSNRFKNIKKIANLESSELSSTDFSLFELQKNAADIYDCEFSLSRTIPRKILIKLVLNEDIESLEKIMFQQDLLAIRDKHNNTLMHIACGFGRQKSVQFLMKSCPELIETFNNKGHQPIDIAIKHGQIDLVKWLIPKTNRLYLDSKEETNQSFRSCLHLAAKHGENEILRYLLSEMFKQQTFLDIKDLNGNTPAHLAAKYNHLNCLQTLVEFNCDVTLSNKNGYTPCFIAEMFGNQECVHYLMIVETCINLSIRVVKLSRKLRETKNNNEKLKAQMEEAIGINNDFINQRENCMNISLEIMQKQLNELESRVANQIVRLIHENKTLIQKINVCIENGNQDDDLRLIENQIKDCREELKNTENICHNVKKMDEKKLNNVKSRFNEIKLNIKNSKNLESEADYLAHSNTYSPQMFTDKEHYEILKKMYQETTHKLMIFRNALKEKNQSRCSSSNQDSSSASHSIQPKSCYVSSASISSSLTSSLSSASFRKNQYNNHSKNGPLKSNQFCHQSLDRNTIETINYENPLSFISNASTNLSNPIQDIDFYKINKHEIGIEVDYSSGEADQTLSDNYYDSDDGSNENEVLKYNKKHGYEYSNKNRTNFKWNNLNNDLKQIENDESDRFSVQTIVENYKFETKK